MLARKCAGNMEDLAPLPAPVTPVDAAPAMAPNGDPGSYTHRHRSAPPPSASLFVPCASSSGCPFKLFLAILAACVLVLVVNAVFVRISLCATSWATSTSKAWPACKR